MYSCIPCIHHLCITYTHIITYTIRMAHDNYNDDLNIDLLTRAAENEDNAHMLELTMESVIAAKMGILNDLSLDDDEKNSIMEKLKGYVYIDEIHEVRSGTYVRWLNMEYDDDTAIVVTSLAKGGIFCDIRFSDYGAVMRCKTFRNQYYEVKLDNVILFRKLTPQEQVLMCALTYLHT